MCQKSINELSPTLIAIARKNESLLLQRLAEMGQNAIAEQMGASESKISRMKADGGIEQIAILTAILGIKLVDKDDLLCTREVAEATRQMLANCFTSPEYVNILFK